MQKIKNYAFILSFVVTATLTTEGNYWWKTWSQKWCSLVIFLAVWLGILIWRKIHWSLGVAFAYTVISGALIFATRGGPYQHEPIMDMITYKNGALYTTFTFVILSMFYLTTLEKLKLIESACAIMCPTAIAMTIWVYLNHGMTRLALGGMFGNPSMNMCFLAMSLPLFTKATNNKTLQPIGFIALISVVVLVLASTTLMPVLTLSGVILAFFFSQFGRRIGFEIGTFAVTCLLLVAWFFNWTTVMDTHGRFRVWAMVTKWWWSHSPTWWQHKELIMHPYQLNTAPHPDLPAISHLWGAGNGVGQAMFGHVQQTHGDNASNHGIFLWMHNDPLQTMFDMGFVGLAIYVIVTVLALKKSYKDPYVFSSLVGLVIASLGNYPCRMAIMAFFGFFLVVKSFTIEKSQDAK